ncbi:hypothetical protein H261_05699 [Paramagnetospirillum caucaseum]|uniref:Uncharacterized protein n=1 Tax=Paramagnetospirillum caucaseum TaxID=1244869 RepID=M3ADL1_9PROT|nr:hypothetical protein [Paramagnetospirillum caucaseum]EME70878.1 hypothetical protein H261_05699 [Paramagnetospirillum caucaseum]
MPPFPAARTLAVLLVLMAPAEGRSQVPPLPGEERMEAAMAAGETALGRKNWSEAAARFAEARAALPDALPPLLGLARAREGLARPLEAATWYRAYLAAAHDPDEAERQDPCRRAAALHAAHRKRTETAIALAGKILKAATATVETAPPPEGGTRQAELARLHPARHDLDLATRARSATPPQPPDAGALNQGVGVTEAWISLAEDGAWREMDSAYRILGERGRKPIERALAAASHARLHALLAGRFDALARITDDVGRGCQ